jgi:hypothetical protein
VLDIRNHQGKFGEDYVRVLASAAGLVVGGYDVDHDGIDLTLLLPGPFREVTSPRVDVQVKSWSAPKRTASGEHWLFRGLNEVQFNKLAGDNFTVPRYLFLIVVPSDARDYVYFSPDDMRLNHLGYFLSLAEESLIEHPRNDRHPAVRVPIGNVLTVRSLLALIHPGLLDLGRTS